MATPSGSYKDESDLGRKVRERGRKRLQQQKFQQEAAAAAVSSSDLEAGGCKRKPLEEADLEKSSQPSSLEVHSEKGDEVVKSDNTDGEKSKDEAASGEEAASTTTKSVIISNPTSAISAYGAVTGLGTMRLTDKSSAEKTSEESPLPEKTEGSPNDSFLEEDSIYGRAGEEDETKDSASDPKPQLPRPPSLMEQILKSYEAERGGRPLPEDEERERENEVEAAVEVREGDQVKFEGVTPAEAEHKRRSSLDDSEELELAVPRLSGFIESWPTPFTSGRFFDTPPPSTPEDDCGTMGLGFTLQKDVSVGPLTVEDSQRLMRHFDRVRDESSIRKSGFIIFISNDLQSRFVARKASIGRTTSARTAPAPSAPYSARPSSARTAGACCARSATRTRPRSFPSRSSSTGTSAGARSATRPRPSWRPSAPSPSWTQRTSALRYSSSPRSSTTSSP